MRPSARISALIELLGQVEEGIAKRGAPADVLVSKYFRERRYAGSKDRRAVSGYLYAILRNREALLWLLRDNEVTPRNMVLAHLAVSEPEALELFDEQSGFAPEALSEEETAFVKGISRENIPEPVAANLPSWALPGFERRFSTEVGVAAKAFNQSAPLDLRVNPLRANSNINNKIKDAIGGVDNTKLSPLGFRSLKNIPLGNVELYKQGAIEVQDEAAQIASMLVDAKPGMQVADLCAGAGGKSLLVSSLMENKGQLYAFDTSTRRLSECKKRAERGGNRNIQTKTLTEDAQGRLQSLEQLVSNCDRVYVDVPCSGTGTWRRSPDQRWRQDSDSIAELNKLQLSLLKEGASLTKTGGRLLYMTCSVLPDENEGVVEQFMGEADPEWSVLDYKSIWRDTIGESAPNTCSLNSKMLQLAPHVHETDGFFVAILERR